MKLSNFILFLILKPNHSMVPPLLTGNVGIGLDLLAVPKKIGYSKIKQDQIKVLKNNEPEYICSEFNEARKMIRLEEENTNTYVSFLVCEKKELVYSIIYRVNSKFPFIYTIKSIIRSPDNDNIHVSILDVETILRQQCEDKRGYLQTFHLKTWANGKYHKEKYLEKQFQ